MTAHADVPMTVQAMKGGAIEFLTKPFRDQDLLDAVEAGLARDRARRESDKALAALKERFDTLSSREREIMVHVVAGRLNKQIANDIGIAEVHREGASHPSDAEDEGAFASRAQPDGGHPQRETTAVVELLSQLKGYRLKRLHASALSLQAITICCIRYNADRRALRALRQWMQKREVRDLALASSLSDGLAKATTSEPHNTTAQSTTPCQTVKTRRIGFAGNCPTHGRL